MQQPLSFFADENIPWELIKWIQQNGFEVSGIMAQGLFGIADLDIIHKSFAEKSVVLTQDSDFGKIIFTTKIEFTAIIYLRPGHLDGEYHIPTMEAILKHSEEIKDNTLIVGERKGNKIKIRIRHL